MVSVCFKCRYSELANKWVLRFNDLDYGLPLGLRSSLLLGSTLAFVGGLRFILGFSHFKNVYRQTSKSIIGNRKNKPETKQTQTEIASNAVKLARRVRTTRLLHGIEVDVTKVGIATAVKGRLAKVLHPGSNRR